jgi:hypothetical protein
VANHGGPSCFDNNRDRRSAGHNWAGRASAERRLLKIKFYLATANNYSLAGVAPSKQALGFAEFLSIVYGYARLFLTRLFCLPFIIIVFSLAVFPLYP